MSKPTSPDSSAPFRALAQKVKNFPESPGVYCMVDEAGTTLYVGKAGNLRKRVASYFTAHRDSRAFIPALLKKVRDVTYLVTSSESEALILENNLIKKYKPLYNIRLKDDKTYLSVKVTVNQPWPGVSVVRRHTGDGALYFGPYASAAGTRRLVRLMKQVFGLRTCSSHTLTHRTRPCMQYEIGRCAGPCAGLISAEQYHKRVKEALEFLRGRADHVLERLTAEMHEAAENLRFEQAASLRDKIRAVQRAMEKQAAHEVTVKEADVFGVHSEGQHLTVQVLFVRNGRVTDAAPYHLRSPLPLNEALRSFMLQFYLTGRDVPPEIVVPLLPADSAAVGALLAQRRGRRVRFFQGRRAQRRALLELACNNAREAARGEAISAERRRKGLGELTAALSLPQVPRRIECFDISTLGGSFAVGSMAVMVGGEITPEAYRHYRIRTVHGQDDFAMLAEVLTRRMSDQTPPPDLLVVDGGRGQVNRAAEVLAGAGFRHTVVVGLAKGRRRAGVRSTERIFLPHRTEPIDLEQDTPPSRLLQALRDEAHRFAVRYHRKLRRQEATAGGLTQVKGLGKKRVRTLYETFGGIRALRRASVTELMRQGKLPRSVAENLYRFLHNKETAPPQNDSGGDTKASSEP